MLNDLKIKGGHPISENLSTITVGDQSTCLEISDINGARVVGDFRVTQDLLVSGDIKGNIKDMVLEDVTLDVPCVNPKQLNIDSKIYGLKIVPVKDNIKSPTPSTLCTVGVVEINVDTMSGIVKEGMVTINGSIDIPKELGRTNSVQDIYFEEKEAARQVAMVFLEEELKKSEEAVESANEIRDFLADQFEAERV